VEEAQEETDVTRPGTVQISQFAGKVRAVDETGIEHEHQNDSAVSAVKVAKSSKSRKSLPRR
jgi:hypothetical protein